MASMLTVTWLEGFSFDVGADGAAFVGADVADGVAGAGNLSGEPGGLRERECAGALVRLGHGQGGHRPQHQAGHPQ